MNTWKETCSFGSWKEKVELRVEKSATKKKPDKTFFLIISTYCVFALNIIPQIGPIRLSIELYYQEPFSYGHLF